MARLILLVLALVFWAGPVLAQNLPVRGTLYYVCGERIPAMKIVTEQYNEIPIGDPIVADNGSIVQLYEGEGSWTFIAFGKGGRGVCFLAQGFKEGYSQKDFPLKKREES
jgi:hypothetical protein